MATNLIRFRQGGGEPQWGVVYGAGISPLSGRYTSTRELIERGEADWRAAAGAKPSLSLDAVEALSPVTGPCRLMCQGANYRQHMIDSGMDPDAKGYNMLFMKSDCSINGPWGEVERPAHVKLLDYEIELALVFRKPLRGGVTVTPQNIHEYVFGLTIVNDVSARDIQIPEMQFFKGKSYRGFFPLGPYPAGPEPHEFGYLDKLTLTLSVNGQVRQHDSTGNLVFKPAETITELSAVTDIDPGDALLTGTPSGCAMLIPPYMVRKLLQFVMSDQKFWTTFKRAQGKRREYLQPGDVMTATIASADRAIDLGEQRVKVTGG